MMIQQTEWGGARARGGGVEGYTMFSVGAVVMGARSGKKKVTGTHHGGFRQGAGRKKADPVLRLERLRRARATYYSKLHTVRLTPECAQKLKVFQKVTRTRTLSDAIMQAVKTYPKSCGTRHDAERLIRGSVGRPQKEVNRHEEESQQHEFAFEDDKSKSPRPTRANRSSYVYRVHAPGASRPAPKCRISFFGGHWVPPKML